MNTLVTLTSNITLLFNMFFLYRTLEVKVSLKKQILFAFGYIFIHTCFYFISTTFRPYFGIITCTIYASFVFKGKFTDFITWALTIVVLDGIIETLFWGLYILIPNKSIVDLKLVSSNILILGIISRLILFFLYFIVTRKVDKSSNISLKNSILFIIFHFSCFAILYILFIYTDKLTDESTKPLLFLISIFLLIIMCSVIALYNIIVADSKELIVTNLKLKTMEMTKAHTDEINSIYDKVSKVKHDLNNHFLAINGFLSNNNYDSLKEYMKAITQFDFETNLYSNHPIVNTIINNFVYKSKTEGINFDFKIQLPESMPLTDVDVCVLLSNILDNAFEANKTVNGYKYVTLNICVNNCYLQIYCCNPNSVYENLKSTDNISSTKKSKDVHGIGTRQIKEIAQSKDGYVSFSCENYKFSTLVMIKLNL